MGSWGTAIKSNDTYADIYGQFFELYNEGHEVAFITQQIINGNQEIIKDKEDCNNLWFALAKAQWECKQLAMDVLDQVQQIIQTESDLEVWRQLGASEKDITKRRSVLDSFLAEITSPRNTPKKTLKKLNRKPIFAKGDCLTFKLANGNFGGAVILESDLQSGQGYNLIATTRINQPGKPLKEDFVRAELLITSFQSNTDKESIYWYSPIRHKAVAHLIDTIDCIDVQLKYNINESMFGFVGDFDAWIIEQFNLQFEWEKTHERPRTKRTIKDLTKNRWKLW